MFYYNLKLLSPLFYRTRQDSGAAGANTTDPWIGDLALSYAINASLGLTKLQFYYTETMPHYEDLLKLPFFTSVATPLPNILFTRVYDMATSFISQGYFNYPAFQKTGNAPMRNWLKRQGLLPGNVFNFAIATRDGWTPPDSFTIRLGNMKETLAMCSKSASQDDVTVNLYTLKLALTNRDLSQSPTLAELIKELSKQREQYQSDLEYIMPQYILLKRVNKENWLSFLDGYS